MRKSEVEDGNPGKSDKEHPGLRQCIAELSRLAAVLGLLSLGTAAIPLGVQLMFQKHRPLSRSWHSWLS